MAQMLTEQSVILTRIITIVTLTNVLGKGLKVKSKLAFNLVIHV